VGGYRVWIPALLLVWGCQCWVNPSWARRELRKLDEPLSTAFRLVLVETPTFTSSSATITTYERKSPTEDWLKVGEPARAKVGRAGVGWGHPYMDLARPGEPIKREGDKRAPAGVFSLSRPFGFGSSNLFNYMQLEKGQHFCVDDTASDHYSRIVSSKMAGPETSGERMWAIDLYRKGILVDYPTSRTAKAGSCIFVHVWSSPDKPTVGCVAASEPTVKRLQKWVSDPDAKAVIAIVPVEAEDRLLGLPGHR
jgi:L,D-peptidoglycan transpeptidase YkuD (ErfK/YbiS/YcfS/YnhG family)